MSAEEYLFTSESVSEGHPDKIADQISDAILDAVLTEDPTARVAVETLVTTNLVVLAGEISTCINHIDYEQIVRKTICDIGYNRPELGFCDQNCQIQIHFDQQSTDIAQGVNEGQGLYQEQGAGDQGMMFGYACNETIGYMPFPIFYAHRLMKKQSEVRKNGILPWLRPDAKAQLTCVYNQQTGQVKHIDTVVLSTQHDEDVLHEQLTDAIMAEVIMPTLPEYFITRDTKFLINPTGRFVIGGPMGDCGVTGRKIIVDTYGGAVPHGGGAFSGKDPSKVDRSAAYAARYVAKNIVAAGLASRCQIQVSYAIGVAEPVSISIDTFGSNVIPNEEIIKLIRTHFDLTPKGIIQMLDLLHPIYKKTACYGHFGQDNCFFPWERLDKTTALRTSAGLFV